MLAFIRSNAGSYPHISCECERGKQAAVEHMEANMKVHLFASEVFKQ